MVKKPEQPDNLVITKVKCAMHVILCNFTKFYVKKCNTNCAYGRNILSHEFAYQRAGYIMGYSSYDAILSSLFMHFLIISLEFIFEGHREMDLPMYKMIPKLNSRLFHASKSGLSCW